MANHLKEALCFVLKRTCLTDNVDSVTNTNGGDERFQVLVECRENAWIHSKAQVVQNVVHVLQNSYKEDKILGVVKSSNRRSEDNQRVTSLSCNLK